MQCVCVCGGVGVRVGACVRVGVWVCVCVRERERERESAKSGVKRPPGGGMGGRDGGKVAHLRVDEDAVPPWDELVQDALEHAELAGHACESVDGVCAAQRLVVVGDEGGVEAALSELHEEVAHADNLAARKHGHVLEEHPLLMAQHSKGRERKRDKKERERKRKGERQGQSLFKRWHALTHAGSSILPSFSLCVCASVCSPCTGLFASPTFPPAQSAPSWGGGP